MRYSRYSCLISTLVILILTAGPQRLMAQAARPAAPGGAGNRPSPTTKPNTPKQEPCWQQAGISKAAMQERRSIEESTRAQIEAVCAQSDLTDKEKREKIHEIREAAKQRMGGLISPQEEEALKACQKSRGMNATPHPKGGGGPCTQLGH